MTTTINIVTAHHDVEIDHIDVSQGYELSRRSEIVPIGESRLVHVWEGREVRIREIQKKEEI